MGSVLVANIDIHEVTVLDKGYVRYVDHLGSDERVVEAARVSYKAPSKGEQQDKKLLEYLYTNRHTSPFEQCSITFNIKMPIFVMRQFVRHRTFRLNEVSGRYTEFEPEFYVPSVWRSQSTDNKQGSEDSDELDHEDLTSLTNLACTYAYNHYKALLNAGAAREMARIVLPVNYYTEIYVNCDLHNLLHFLELRTHSHAQKEIRDYAEAMAEVAQKYFPWTMDVFNKNRR